MSGLQPTDTARCHVGVEPVERGVHATSTGGRNVGKAARSGTSLPAASPCRERLSPRIRRRGQGEEKEGRLPANVCTAQGQCPQGAGPGACAGAAPTREATVKDPPSARGVGRGRASGPSGLLWMSLGSQSWQPMTCFIYLQNLIFKKTPNTEYEINQTKACSQLLAGTGKLASATPGKDGRAGNGVDVAPAVPPRRSAGPA